MRRTRAHGQSRERRKYRSIRLGPSTGASTISAVAPLPRRRWDIYFGALLGLLLAVGLVAASALLGNRNAQLLEDVTRSEDTRAAAATVLNDLTSAETGQRGFLLTHDNSYLVPYLHGRDALPAALDALEATLPGISENQALMPELRRIVTSKLDELAKTIALAQVGDLPGALALVQTGRGERDMSAARVLVETITRQQQSVLDTKVAAVNHGSRLLIYGDAIGFVLLASIAGALAYSSWRTFLGLRAAQTELNVAYDALSQANETLEDRVRERTLALTEANEEIQRFAYIVSHDLRAPLVNIMGFTSEMEGASRIVRSFASQASVADPAGTRDLVLATEEDIPESIEFIKTSAAKMDRLIGAILRLSREGRRVLASEAVDMNALLQGITDSLRHQTAMAGAVITVSPLPGIISDRLVLEQVFSNIVENALKYLRPGRPGVIAVSGRAEGDKLVYEVADNGRGIAPRDMDRVFELFRRAGDQTVPGEGIGLAHARALVRRLGGQIDCVSAEGVGSTFQVVLPGVTPAASLTLSEHEEAAP